MRGGNPIDPKDQKEFIDKLADVRGKVVNEKGEPIPGASIVVKGTKIGTVADSKGEFKLSVSGKTVTLVISYVGYKSQTMTVHDGSFVNVTLKESSSGLTEVVVTAFGISKAKRSIAYASSSVNNTEITNAGTANLATALAGKMPGADFVSTSGGAMAGNRINLRGINSLDVNSRPLVVVNGIPIFDNDDRYVTRGFGNSQKGSGINDINPDDIESLTVLKGANAAALYGSQAINGAIIIQTKSGKDQEGIGVEYSTNYTVNHNTYFPKFQNEYGAGVTSADVFDTYLTNVPGYSSIPFYTPRVSAISFGPAFDNQPVLWWDGKIRPWAAQHNNYRDLFSDGAIFNNTVAFSGSTEKSSFRLSATNYNYNGFLPNMKETRKSVLFYGSQKISNAITAEVYANYIDNYRQNPPERIDRANYSLNTNDITSLLRANTINPQGFYLTDSAYKYLNGTSQSNNILQPLIWNPTKNRYEDSRVTFLGTATITVKLMKQLSLRLRGGTDRLFDILELKMPFTTYVAATDLNRRSGGYNKSQTNNYKNHGDVLLTYNGNINKDISVDAFAGYSMDDEYDETSSISAANGLMYNNFYSTSNYKAVPIKVNGVQVATRPGYNASAAQAGERLDAVFASVTFGYKNWLYLTATDRNDWSSYLPSYSNHYNYPSIGSSFIFSDVFKLPDFVTYGKLRASYGITGVPGSRYFANASYSQGSTYNNAILSSFSNTVPPTNLVAEKNRSFETGLETGFWKNRLKLDFTYYINTSDNMINSVPIAVSTGATNLNINSGTLQNKGIEIQLTGDVIRSKNIVWQMTLNGTHIDRKVLSLAEGLTSRVLGNPFTATLKAVPGGQPYDIYMLPLNRDPKTGKVIVDKSGNPTFSSTMADMGNPLPKFYGGYINSVTYKRLTFTALLEFRFGGKIVSYDNVFWTATGLSENSLAGRDTKHGGIAYFIQNGLTVPLSSGTPPAGAQVYHDGIIFDGVTSTGTDNTTIIPASTYYQNRYYSFGTADAVFENNYIQLREVSLGYSFPSTVAKKLKVQGLSVSFIARNLLFLYKTLPNESPYATLGTDNVNSAVAYSAYPVTRDFGASLKVNF